MWFLLCHIFISSKDVNCVSLKVLLFLLIFSLIYSFSHSSHTAQHWNQLISGFFIFNRPGLAGAVLQSTSWLIHSLIQSVREPFPPNHQNIINQKPEELGCMSRVMCYMSCVTWHVTVTCHMSNFFWTSGEAYWWRVYYQRGLPRLVFLKLEWAQLYLHFWGFVYLVVNNLLW